MAKLRMLYGREEEGFQLTQMQFSASDDGPQPIERFFEQVCLMERTQDVWAAWSVTLEILTPDGWCELAYYGWDGVVDASLEMQLAGAV